MKKNIDKISTNKSNFSYSNYFNIDNLDNANRAIKQGFVSSLIITIMTFMLIFMLTLMKTGGINLPSYNYLYIILIFLSIG
ncbi:MAG: hypothetical protein OEV44_08060, partial [Spirochaetota bacterium]|nr:hypothetical protein [Spirochaetota bacterium]